MENMPPKSVYRHASEAGPVVALPLLVAAASMLLVNKFSAITVLMIPALVSVPFLLYRLMGRLASSGAGYGTYWPLWLFGIYSFIFATLICALASALYLVFIEPAFIVTYFNNALQGLEAMSGQSGAPDFSTQIEVLRSAIERRMLPSSMELVASMSWLSAFGGAVLSAVVARVFVTLKARRDRVAAMP